MRRRRSAAPRAAPSRSCGRRAAAASRSSAAPAQGRSRGSAPASATDARSPRRPPSITCSPMNIRASRNVPVAITTARHGKRRRRSSRRRRPARRERSSRSASATISSTPLSLQQLGDRRAVELAVRLDARTPDRRPLAAVEHAPVDRRAVGRARHQPVEHVELAHQMALADAADRRVARHLPGVLGAEGQQPDARARGAPRQPQPRSRHGRRRSPERRASRGALARSMFHVKHSFAEAEAAEQERRAHPRRPRGRSAGRTPPRACRRSSAISTRSSAPAAAAERIARLRRDAAPAAD